MIKQLKYYDGELIMKEKANNIIKSMLSFGSKKEVRMLCIIILIIAAIFLRVHADDIGTYVITTIISVDCSVLAATLVPKIVQMDEFQNMENNIVREMGNFFNNQYKSQEPTYYSDTNDPHRRFNEKLNRSISETNTYLYFSDRALYLTKRLGRDILETNNRLSIKVFLADVREPALFEARSKVYMQRWRALNREKTAQNKLIQGTMSEEDIINEEKLEVLRSLYALGKLQEKYDIQVYLHKEIPFIRFEITDDLLVLSFLTQLSTGKRYPDTLIYEREDVFKKNFQDYANEVITRSQCMSSEQLQLDKLLEMGVEAKIKDCNEETIVSHYNKNVKS